MIDAIPGDILTNSRKKIGDVSMLEGSRGGLEFRVIRNHLPLNKYLSAGHINHSQFRAGNRLYRLYATSSHIHTPVQMRYDDIGRSLKEYETKFIINQDYMAAMMALTSLHRAIVTQVCLDSIKCGRGNMEILKEGLNQLVRHFKLDTKNR